MADTNSSLTGPGSDGGRAPLPDSGKTKAQTSFKVLDVRAKDVTLEMEDGRAFIAELDDTIAIDDLKRGSMVNIKSDGMDKTDAPKAARVTKILPKD